MKIILVITLITFMSGCTSLQPIDMQASELQYQIKTSNIVKVGDEVEVLTPKSYVKMFSANFVPGVHRSI